MQYICRPDIEALRIGIEDVVSAPRAAFLAAHNGRIVWKPKATINQPDGVFLIATHAAWAERNRSIFHSIIGTSHEFVPACQARRPVEAPEKRSIRKGVRFMESGRPPMSSAIALPVWDAPSSP
jgi:hypothetical protein